MFVRQVMSRSIVTTKPDTSLKEASRIMGEMHIGCLVVLDESEKIVGIVTNSDVLRAIANDKDPNTTLISDIMSRNVKVVEPDKSLEDAIKLMVDNKIKKLPVVENDKLIGIITASDIAVVQPRLIASISSLLSIRVPMFSGG
jgi:CBS domain-containing protein